MNRVIIIGNLGREPEMRYTPTGQAVTSFSVASNHRYTDSQGQRKSETEWFNCSAFGKLAETCNQYLTKGQQVYIEGRLKSRTYQGRDGQTRFSNDVMVSDMQFLGSKAEGQRDSQGATEEEPGAYDGDDLPF
jgi:single-strand DNA-binding protein